MRHGDGFGRRVGSVRQRRLPNRARRGHLLRPRYPDEPSLVARPVGNFDHMVKDRFPLTYVLLDGCAFVLSTGAIDELRFLQGTVGGA